ncbi:MULTISPECIES: DUF928 domain-containing protein [unclassified Coleofasciculus]|uniref:DUF928 domain-containing protein n=1 Tax=unclassified Coleofasciculus TaxID=2692782 RepID=UPI00187E26CD|nr:MULTISPECIES: DUF928 domain-containing protein [unclassified Coleofasciculus]MBE9127373.1 DUF928 domain-containing protein [Coleofasciculus sp. LEGE 07081]MBE9147361.1 DUF928 domain-containing protein [Coleofasciculus sp. LEGE 07092]
MVYWKHLSYLGAFGVTLFLQVATFSLAVPQLKAQSLEVSLTFPPGKGVGAPARTGGGGRRSGLSCVQGNIPLTALTPTNNLITTASGNPTLFWYIPATKADSAELIVVDEEGNEVYLNTLALQNAPGVVELSLPEQVSLEPNKRYIWQFSIICNPLDRSEDNYVRGWIERKQSQELDITLAELNQNLKELETNPCEVKKRLQQQAKDLAGAQIWAETITILARLYQTLPKDRTIATEWEELLESVELNAIATKPLLDCCRPEPQPTDGVTMSPEEISDEN